MWKKTLLVVIYHHAFLVTFGSQLFELNLVSTAVKYVTLCQLVAVFH